MINFVVFVVYLPWTVHYTRFKNIDCWCNILI